MCFIGLWPSYGPLSLASLDSSPARGRAKTYPLGYCLPRLRDCAAEALPAAETAEAEQGQRSAFCKPAATGAAKTGHRNRGPQGRRGPRLRDCEAEQGSATVARRAREGNRQASLRGTLQSLQFLQNEHPLQSHSSLQRGYQNCRNCSFCRVCTLCRACGGKRRGQTRYFSNRCSSSRLAMASR